MKQMTSSLYEKLGGKAGISPIVDRFYGKVLADPTVNHFFAHTDMAAQRRHQTAFLAFALGGPAYSGRSMEKAHAGLNLQPKHFDAILHHLSTTLAEVGIGPADVQGVTARLETLRESVLYK